MIYWSQARLKVLEGGDIVLELEEILAGLSLKLMKEEESVRDKNSGLHSEVSNIDLQVSTRLPKLELPVFKGNPLDWQTF